MAPNISVPTLHDSWIFRRKGLALHGEGRLWLLCSTKHWADYASYLPNIHSHSSLQAVPLLRHHPSKAAHAPGALPTRGGSGTHFWLTTSGGYRVGNFYFPDGSRRVLYLPTHLLHPPLISAMAVVDNSSLAAISRACDGTSLFSWLEVSSKATKVRTDYMLAQSGREGRWMPLGLTFKSWGMIAHELMPLSFR